MYAAAPAKARPRSTKGSGSGGPEVQGVRRCRVRGPGHPDQDSLRTIEVLGCGASGCGASERRPRRRSGTDLRSTEYVWAAIAAVMLTHLNLQIGGGGVIGVDIFFVLSGFLITTLLLEERHRWGRLAIGKFYARRALRLLPALWFMLFGVAVYALVAHGTRQHDIVNEVLESALYVRNLPLWHGAAVMLGHTWALLLEEQFYLIWPLIFLLFGPRGLRSLSWCSTHCSWSSGSHTDS